MGEDKRERRLKLFKTLYDDGNSISLEGVAFTVAQHDVRVESLENTLKEIKTSIEGLGTRLLATLATIIVTLITVIIDLALRGLGR
jgi:hypothetical protein